MTQLIDLGKLRFFFAGEWDAASQYEVNDVVRYGGHLYVYTYALATKAHLPTETGYWQVMVRGLNFRGTYAPATAYRLGDVVTYGPVAYIALVDATGVTPSAGGTWGALTSGVRFTGAYAPATAYVPGDVVTFGNGSYVAVTATTGYLPVDAARWAVLTLGLSGQGAYAAATTYHLGDVVSYGGRTYRALGETVGNLPTDTAKWALHQDGMRQRGEWAPATDYLPNDVVQRGGSMYLCTAVHTSAAAFATDLATRWTKRTPGFRWRGTLTSGTAYLVDDVVTDALSSYLVTADFTATSGIASEQAALTLLARGADYLPAQAPRPGGRLHTDGAAPYWSAFVAVGAGNAAVTAKAGDTLLVDLSGVPSVRVTLPATPHLYARVVLVDLANLFGQSGRTVTVLRNALKIEGRTEDLVIDVSATVELIYTGTTYGWKVL